MGANEAIVVRPRLPPLAIVAAIIAAVALVLGWVLNVAAAPIAVALLAGGWACQLLLDRGRVRSVRFEPSGAMVLVTRQIEQTFDANRVGGVGYSGSVVSGRLSLSLEWARRTGWVDPLASGRIVVIDRNGDVHAAMRASWIVVKELSEAVSLAGLAWAGKVSLQDITLGAPASAGEDSAVDGAVLEGAVRRMRRDARFLLRAFTGGLAALLAAVVLGSLARVPEVVVDPFEVVFWIGVFVWLLLAGTERLRTRPVRAVRRLLEHAEWSSVDAVVLRGAPVDPGVRILVLVDPLAGISGASWLVEPSVTARWIQEFQRDRFRLGVGVEGETAVLQSNDGSRLALLVRSTGWGKAPELHEWAHIQLTEEWRVRPSNPGHP